MKTAFLNVITGKNDLIIAGLLACLVFVLLFTFASPLVFPGHGDPCYYIDLARNLATGRGFVIDYISYFHHLPEQVSHETGDYWMPLTSLVHAAVFMVFPPDFKSVQLTSAVLAALFIVVMYRFGRFGLELDRPWAIAACVMVALDIDWLYTFLIPQSGTFFMIIVWFYCRQAAKMNAAMRGTVLSTGVLMGLAHLSRPDGILLWPVTIGIVLHGYLRNSLSLKRITRMGIVIVIGYFCVMGPWFVRNTIVFGTPLPVPSSHFPYITDYEQIFALRESISRESFLASGPAAIIASKFDEAWRNLQAILHFRLIILLGLVALAGLLRHDEFRIAGLYLVILWFVMSFIMTLPGHREAHGSFSHALPALLPFFYLAMACGGMAASRIITNLKHTGIRMTGFVFFHVLIGLVLIYSLFGAWTLFAASDSQVVSDITTLYTCLTSLDAILPDDAIVMTRNPWEVHYVTGRHCVQIPSDGMKSFQEIVRKYRVTHLLLTDERRPWLDDWIETRRETGMAGFVQLASCPCSTRIFHYTRFELFAFDPLQFHDP